MLDRLALAGLGALGDGAGDEDDELPGGAALEEAEVADVRGVGQHERLGALPAAGGGAPGAPGRRLQHDERRDLHLRSDEAARSAATLGGGLDGWVWTGDRRAEVKEASPLPFPTLLDSVDRKSVV